MEAPEPIPDVGDAELADLLLMVLERLQEPSASDVEAVSHETGFPPAHAAEAMRRAFVPFGDESLRRLVDTGSRSRTAAATRTGERTWMFAILAGRVPAVAANAMFWALAARVPLVIKPSYGLGAFTGLLVSTLDEAGGPLAGTARIFGVGSGSGLFSELVAGAPACLAYGGDRTFGDVVSRRTGLPTFGGGHMESFTVLFREALTADRKASLAGEIAVDCSIYDQAGCLSPHYLLVEEGGDIGPKELAQAVHREMTVLLGTLPPGSPALDEAAALRAFAEESRFAGTEGGRTVFPPSGASWPLVVFTRNGPLRQGPGHRVLQTAPFSGVPDLPSLLPWLAGRVQGAAVGGEAERRDRLFARHPAYRPNYVCVPGRLQLPPAMWAENGTVLTRELAGL